jgi:hypothetical protein
MLVAAATSPSNPLTAIVVAVLLVAVSRLIIVRVASAEGKSWLVPILTVSLILHLLASPAQIFVVDHFYHGTADWLRYDHQGSLLAPGFRHLNFSLAPGNLRGIVNDGSVSIAAGVVFAFVGFNQVAAFMVFSWLAFIGTIFFFRAFSLTFAGADHRRYAYLVFLFPSLIFWTADVSKEAIMIFSLGIISYGAAKVLRRRSGGYVLVVVGGTVGVLIRPNELLLVMGGFVAAIMVTPAVDRTAVNWARRGGSVIFLGALLAVSVFLTLHYLHTSGGSLSLNQLSTTQGLSGASGGVSYSTNFLYYPRDVYTVLLDPLPINFHGATQLIAALENTLILAIVLASLRQLRIVPRAAFARPYVMLCAVYTAAFMYTFAALGNLGLITRERTLVFPFLFVLACIPRGPRRQRPRYEWELRRSERRRLRARGWLGPPPPGVGSVPLERHGRPSR